MIENSETHSSSICKSLQSCTQHKCDYLERNG